MSNTFQPLPIALAGPMQKSDFQGEPSMRGDLEAPLALAREVRKLVVLIERMLAEPGAAPASDGLAAVERIQDIAFALREGRADAPLCDSLETAAREAHEAFARREAATEQAKSAAALLRSAADGMSALAAPVVRTDAEPLAIQAVAEATAAGASLRESLGDGSVTSIPPTDALPKIDGSNQPPDKVASAVPKSSASGDSLAALRALSEEELIALFS